MYQPVETSGGPEEPEDEEPEDEDEVDDPQEPEGLHSEQDGEGS